MAAGHFTISEQLSIMVQQKMGYEHISKYRCPTNYIAIVQPKFKIFFLSLQAAYRTCKVKFTTHLHVSRMVLLQYPVGQRIHEQKIYE